MLADQLISYFSVLGKDPSKFEPQGVKYSKRAADGSWSDEDLAALRAEIDRVRKDRKPR